MSTDSPEFWNDIWADIEDCSSGSDQILAGQVGSLSPGYALEIGCGTGGNAVWLANQGWQVTAVDYSMVAIEKGQQMAADQGATVEFVVADASTYQPQGHYDLITSFYIQLFPGLRAAMLANMSKALAPGGYLLFVGHDKSGPPLGWTEEDMLSLTTPEEVVSDLIGLEVKEATVTRHDSGLHAVHSHYVESGENEVHYSGGSFSTVVMAWRSHESIG